MYLKLYGVVSIVDEKKITLGGHHDTIEKLNRLSPPGKSPIKDNQFYALCKSVIIPSNIVGKKVIIWGVMRKYSFTSTLDYNRGDVINGWSIHLKKLEINGDW